MAIKYLAGNKLTGTQADRTGLASGVTDYLIDGTLFYELGVHGTDIGNDIWKWDKLADAWELVTGNTETENLSNKTFTDYCKVSEVSTPSGTVGAGKGVIYAKTVSSVGKAFWKFENETEIELTAGAAVGNTLAGHTDTDVSGQPSSGTTGHILVWDNSDSWDNKLLQGVGAGVLGECAISITNGGLVALSSITGLANTGPVLDLVSAGSVSIFPTLGNSTLSVGASGSTVNILGNLTVSGVTTTVNTQTLTVEDPLILLSSGAPNSAGAVDAGFVVERGSETNVAFVWDETEDAFGAFATSSDASGAGGNMNVGAYQPLQIGGLTATTGTFSSNLTTNRKLLIDTAAFNITLGADGHLFHIDAQTLTDNTTAASGTASANFALFTIDQPTLAATNASTTTIASTMSIAGAPAAGLNATLTNSYALYVAAGKVKIVGDLETGDTVLGSLVVTGTTWLKGTVRLGDATADDVTFDGYVASHIIPKTDSTYNLGTAALQWSIAYIDTIGETGDGAILIEPRIGNGGFIADSAGNQQIIFTTTGSAVNEITIANAATGGSPTIAATGGDTNVGLTLQGKGTGASAIVAGGATGACIEFNTKYTGGAPSGNESARLYLKEVDANNNALAVRIFKANAYQEVEITSPKAICGECGSTDGAKDPTYDFSRSMMLVELWCGHSYEVPMTGWNMVS